MTFERIVVVDVETSGLNPLQDKLIAIGAVALHGSLVRFDDSFYAVLRQEEPSRPENIVVHGIGGTAQLEGEPPAHALTQWLAYAADAPLAGFRVDFDRLVIERTVRDVLRRRIRNKWLDLASLLPAVFPQHARSAHSLDEWTRLFGIDIYERHNAVADALATAQLLQIAFPRAAEEGVRSAKDLIELERNARWLRSH